MATCKIRETADLFGRRIKTVSRDHDGNSALTSIMNYWLLTNPSVHLDIPLADAQICPYVKNFIAGKLIDIMRSRSDLPTANANDLELCTELFSLVQSNENIYLSPMPSSIKMFEETLQYEIFCQLGVPVLHTGIVGETLSIQSLSSLSSEIEDKVVKLLYWNNSFCTICKYNGTILMLIDDNDFLEAHPRAVWKILGMGNQKETLVDKNFSLISRVEGTCSNCALEFHSNINFRRHSEVHLPASKDEQGSTWNEDNLEIFWNGITSQDAKSLLLHGASNVEKTFGSSFDEIVKNWTTSPEFRFTPSNEKKAVWMLKGLLERDEKPPSIELLPILRTASESTFLCNNILQKEALFDEMLTGTDATVQNLLACISLSIEHELAERWKFHMGIKADEIANELLRQELSKEKKHTLKNKSGVKETHWSDESPVAPEPLSNPPVA